MAAAPPPKHHPGWVGVVTARPRPSSKKHRAAGHTGPRPGRRQGRAGWEEELKKERNRQQGVLTGAGRKGPRPSTPALPPLPVDFSSGSSNKG